MRVYWRMGNYATKNFLSWVLNAGIEVSEMMGSGRAFHRGTTLMKKENL